MLETSNTMNDIVLLMTGVITTKQLSPSNLPKQPVIQLDKGVQKSTQSQSYQSVTSAKITPPEFMELDESPRASLLAHKPEYQKPLKNKTQNVPDRDFYSVAEFSNFQAVKVRFPNQQRLTRKQNRNKIIVAKSQGLSFPKKQSRSGILAVRSQRFIIRSRRFTTQMPTLSFGSSGVAVRVLQKLLVANGYAIRSDGVFGALTESAIKAFQNRRGLSIDGIVGSRTWLFLAR